MKELKNRQEVLEAIVGMLMDHDIKHVGFQEDIYLYITDDGIGTVETFQNVGGCSWLNDDHITVYQMSELHTDWTYYVPEISDIANVLEWSVNTLRERTAAWISETRGYITAEDVGYQDIRDFIESHQPLMDQIIESETDYIRTDCYDDYMASADQYLDAALDDEGVYII